MKKAILFAALSLGVSGAVTAQSFIKLAPEIGINFANLHGERLGVKNDYGVKLGMKAGINFEMKLAGRISFQPGLFYSIKGGKGSVDTVIGGVTGNTNHNYTFHYFEIPLNFQYYFNDPNEGQFFVGVGGYLGVPFSGHDKRSITVAGVPNVDTTEKLNFGSDPDKDNQVTRFDYGVSANAGYYLRSGIFFRAMYQLGLANNLPGYKNYSGSGNQNYLHHSVISVSAGYVIGGHHASMKGKKSNADMAK